MRVGGRRRLVLGLLLLVGPLVPSPARGQPGWYVTPSFSVAEVYDDNLFVTAREREADFISRFSPEIQGSYQSAPLTILGRYTFDAEIFARHAELNSALARQQASTELRYLPTPLLALSFNGLYLETHTPGELTLETGLEIARARAQRFSLGPALAYRFDPLTTAAADYTFMRDESAGIATETQTANLSLDRRLTAQDSGTLAYTHRHFAHETADTTTSHTVTLAWTREVTALTGFTLRGGPRFSDGSVDPEVSASIRHRLKAGDLSFTYARSETTVIGRPGTVNTESFVALASYQLLPSLRVSAAPGFYISRDVTSEAKVFRVTLDATYQITKWLALVGSYQFSLQRSRFAAPEGVPGRPDEEILHNVIMLRLTATAPYRVY